MDDACHPRHEVGAFQPVAFGREAERVHEALLERRGCGGGLKDAQALVRIRDDAVGKGAADIDADPEVAGGGAAAI